MKKMFHKVHQGYTLAEILVVSTILVLLGLALLIGINPLTQIFKGYDARRRADLARIKIALEAYYSDHDCYPIFPKDPVTEKPTYECDSGFLKPYLDIIPCDPTTKQPYTLSLIPEDFCPQQFAVYAQVYSFFDKNLVTPFCPKTIFSSSPNASQINIINGCTSTPECYDHYGCVSGTCQKISSGTLPICHKNKSAQTWCEPDCGSIVDCATAIQCN